MYGIAVQFKKNAPAMPYRSASSFPLGSECAACGGCRSVEAVKAIGATKVHLSDPVFREINIPYFDNAPIGSSVPTAMNQHDNRPQAVSESVRAFVAPEARRHR